MPNNYSVTSSAIEAVVGTQVNLTTPTVTLTIAPYLGYTVSAGDFSIGDPLPTEVTSAVFSQSGTNVECLITFADSFIMPAADVSLAIDIDGAAVLIQYSISGTYDIITRNTNQVTSSGIAYSGSGTIGEQITLFTLTFTADANHLFETEPSYVNSITNTLPANYNITRADTYSGDLLSQVIYTVKYTLTAVDITGDKLTFTARAKEQLVIGTPEYYSYTFSGFTGKDLNGDFFANDRAQTYVLRIFGDFGALVTATLSDGITPTVLYTDEPITNIDGYVDLLIPIPAVVTDTDYTVTLAGSINVSFVQPNPIVIHQVIGTTVTLSHDALPGYTITRAGDYTKTGVPGLVPREDRILYSIEARFTITKDDGSKIKFLRTPTWDDISNINSLTNGGTLFLYSNNLRITGDGTSQVTVEIDALIVQFGTSNVICSLSLVDLFNLNPVAVNDSAAVEKGKSVLIDVLANDSDADGDTLAPVVITQPLYGTAIVEGTSIRYTHNNSSNLEDSFTYSANDGYINSIAATVSITVGLAAGDSLQLSATDGIFYIPYTIGEQPGTFTIHFNAGDTPDRVELIYDGEVVADSLFIGDDLTNANRAAAITAIEAVTSLQSFDYVGSGGNGLTYGQTKFWDYAGTETVAFADPADVAPTGNVRGTTSNYGGQEGVGNLVYTSPTDVIGTTGLDSADGNASISYVKTTSGAPSSIIIKVTGISGTGWSIYQSAMTYAS